MIGLQEFNWTGCNGSDFRGGSLMVADLASLLSAPATLFVWRSPPDTAQLQWQPALGLTSGNDGFAIGMYVAGSGVWDVSVGRLTGTLAAGTIALTTTDLTASTGLPGFTNGAPPATAAFWHSGNLWFQSNTVFTPPGGLSHYGARVTEVATTPTPAVGQDFTIEQADTETGMGSIAVAGDGTLYLAFTQQPWSSGVEPSGPVSLFGTYQAPGDAPNSVHAPALIAAGVAPWKGGRWGLGGQGQLAYDPSDPHVVWQGGAFSNADGDWSTWISRLSGGAAAPPTGALDIDGGSATSDSLRVSLSTTPTPGSGMTQVLLSNSPTTSGGLLAQALQYPTFAQVDWDLADASSGGTRTFGVRQVYVQWGDGAGTWSSVKSASIDVEPNVYVPLTPTRLLDTRYGNGLTGAFSANHARTFQVTGRGGVPASAVAVTGNLTVTRQTGAGYLYLGPIATNTPSSSTLNFPTGDNRANGVTVALSGDGKLAVTYAAAAGKTAHAIFDVTGYFLPGVSGATYVPLTPTRLLDTRYGNGLTGAFSANHARTFQVTGRGGVPASAVAVTGNLTVTSRPAPATCTSARSRPTPRRARRSTSRPATTGPTG